MLVRAKRTHYADTLRVEGSEWEHGGKLYDHIEPVKVKGKAPAASAKAAADAKADDGEAAADAKAAADQ